MRSATVDQLQENPGEIIALLELGEVVNITREGHAFAVLSPVPSTNRKTIVDWAARERKLNEIYPSPTNGASSEELIDYSRGDT